MATTTERRGSRVLQFLSLGFLGNPSSQGNVPAIEGYAEKRRSSSGRGGAYDANNYNSSVGYGGSSRINARNEALSSVNNKVSTMRRKGRGSIDNENNAMVLQSSSGKQYKRGSLSTAKLPNINGRDSSVTNNIYSPEVADTRSSRSRNVKFLGGVNASVQSAQYDKSNYESQLSMKTRSRIPPSTKQNNSPSFFERVSSMLSPRSAARQERQPSIRNMPDMGPKYADAEETSSQMSVESTNSTRSKRRQSALKAPADTSSKKLCCDKCDGAHETEACPYFKKKRESHPDAQKNFYKKLGQQSSLPGAQLRTGRVVRQPGDGSCLFHSLSYGIGGGNATTLRHEICDFISKDSHYKISEVPLSDWVKWDSGTSSGAYAKKMKGRHWGGGIEMAVCSYIKKCNVHVYEKSRYGNGFKRISAFDYPKNPERVPIVRVVYQGGIHYDALEA